MTQLLFHTYQQDFVKGYSNTNRKIQLIPNQSNQKKQLAFQDIRADLQDLQRYVKLMETQLISVPPFNRGIYQQKVRQYKKDFDDLRKKLNKQKEQFAHEKTKQALLNAQLDDERAYGFKSKLLDDGEKLNTTTFKLKQSIKIMHQSLQISHNVGNQLQDHTRRLQDNKKKMGDIRGDLKIGEKRINSMMLRIRKNKFIMAAVFSVILLVGVIVLAIKLFKK